MNMGIDEAGSDQFAGCINDPVHRTFERLADMDDLITLVDDDAVV
jgi:hypothetical protein